MNECMMKVETIERVICNVIQFGLGLA